MTVLARRPLPSHIVSTPPPSKLNFIQHSDFLSYPPSLLAQLNGHDAVLWDLGKTAIGSTEAQYTVFTKDYALAAANAFANIERAGPGKFVFCYLSGQGTSQVEGKAGQMFGRVKGRAEKALAEMNEDPVLTAKLATYSFRPAGIEPVAPVPEAGRVQRWLGPLVSRTRHGGASGKRARERRADQPGFPSLFRFPHAQLFPIIRTVYPAGVISTKDLANGMLRAALTGGSGSVPGWEGKGKVGDAGVFDNEEIKRLAKEAAKA